MKYSSPEFLLKIRKLQKVACSRNSRKFHLAKYGKIGISRKSRNFVPTKYDENLKFAKFAKISSREIFQNADRENKFSRKFGLAKIKPREN